MSRIARSALTFVLLVLAVGLATAPAEAAETRQWMLTPSTSIDRIAIDTPYNLTNDTGGHLGFGSRTFGADLVWGGTDRFSFRRANRRDHRAVRVGENVALYDNATRHYLCRSYQDFGIDLDWWSAPCYQWQAVTGQTQIGNVRTAIYNVDKGAYLIYQPRTWGINLGFQGGASPGAAY